MAPIPKANTSVNDVTVMATPACFIVKPIFSCKVLWNLKLCLKLSKHYNNALVKCVLSDKISTSDTP